jgi:hypothetical protein
MAGNNSLIQRLVAAAAAEGLSEPLGWVQQNIWSLVSSPDWDDAWDYAKGAYTPDYNPDFGARPGVINDNMILAAVQALIAEQNPPPAP